MPELIFLRPLWLLVLPLAFLPWMRRRRQDAELRAIFDPELAKIFVSGGRSGASFIANLGWAAAISCCALALAGVALPRAEVPLIDSGEARVFVLDLSRSMLAQDVAPNRVERAKLKLLDALDQSEGGRNALIVFAGSAFVVTPLTGDVRTIKSLVPVLEPDLMPVQGSAPEEGVRLALELLEQGDAFAGHIVLIGDDAGELGSLTSEISGRGARLSILAIGTQTGAPIPEDGSGFVRDADGVLVMAKTDHARLRNAVVGGDFATLSADESDLARLLAPRASGAQNVTSVTSLQARELGPYFLLPVVLLVLLGFRRNAWFAACVVIVAVQPDVRATDWNDFWERADRQYARQMQAGNYTEAEATARDSLRLGAALYRQERFEEAAQAFARAEGKAGSYNLGNALAQLGRIDEAIEAYDRALDEDPDFEDARFNKELLEQMREQQQSQQNSSQDSQEQQNPSADEGSANSQSSQEGDEQESVQQGAEQAQTQMSTSDEPGDQEQATQQAYADNLSREEQQELEQWLRRIPDDPGGLLRRKFLRQYQERDEPPRGKKTW